MYIGFLGNILFLDLKVNLLSSSLPTFYYV